VRFELVEGHLSGVEEEMIMDAAGYGATISHAGRYRPTP